MFRFHTKLFIVPECSWWFNTSSLPWVLDLVLVGAWLGCGCLQLQVQMLDSSGRLASLCCLLKDWLQYWSQLSTTCAAIQNAFISFIKNWFLRIHHLLQVVRCLRRWSDCLLRVAPCSLWWSWKSRCHHPCLCCHGPVAEVAISYISNFNPIHLLANPTIWCSLLGNFWLLDSW